MLSKTCVFSCANLVAACAKGRVISTVVKSTSLPAVVLNNFLTHYLNRLFAFIYTPITSFIGGFYTLFTPITINITIFN